MKISKSLLGAMLVGIAIQTTTASCTKKDQVKPQAEKGKVQSAETPPTSDPCPACGMG